MSRVVALLDRPAPESFGMVPVAIERTDGKIQALGLATTSAHRAEGLTRHDLSALLRAGHAVDTSAGDLDESIDPSTVALWLGDTFDQRARALELPPAPLPATRWQADGGGYFLGAAADMYPYLERWTVLAFRRFQAEAAGGRKAIAELMQWVLPNRPEALAVAWATAADRQRAVQLQLRSFARGQSPEGLVAAHTALLSEEQRDPVADLRLVVFAGGKGVGRQMAAKRFAEQFDLPVRHFVRAIEARIPEHDLLESAERTRLLMKRGQEAVDASPLALAMGAISLDQPKAEILVLDGLRHLAIRDTIRWLQPLKVFVVGITADENVRRAELKKSGEDPDWVFRHRTERDVPQLMKEADMSFEVAELDQRLDEIFLSAQA